ncbi:glycoside hydrolase family 2, partial [Pseudoxanthomonas sp. SGD-10]
LAGPVHQGSFYRFKYDITDKLKYADKNLLEVTVSKMSADRSVNNAERLADYWIFGGIFRPVYLESLPQENISWTAIDAKADGTFKMNVYTENIQSVTEVMAEIINDKQEIVQTIKSKINRQDSLVQLKTSLKSPKLWSAETPNLYSVKVSLRKGGEVIYQTTEKFGFRTIEVREGDGIYVNGAKIKFKGVNRHVWWPTSGRSVNSRIDLEDVKLIKGMNMNAVRCAHYPPDKTFLQYCDSLGLYVLNELAGWQKAYNTKTGSILVKEMIQRDVNHPSIILWSNGNEGGHNFDLLPEYPKYDLSNRTVIHAHHRPGNAINGIDCNHYEDYYSTQNILKGPNIYLTTEFLHSQDDGGAAAGLQDIWELHWNAKLGAGGFLWALVDEGLVRTDFNNRLDVNGVNAPDGIVGPYREKEGSYFAIKEIFSPVKMLTKRLEGNFKGELEIENRYHFTNLKACQFSWELIDFSKPHAYETGHKIINRGSIISPDV